MLANRAPARREATALSIPALSRKLKAASGAKEASSTLLPPHFTIIAGRYWGAAPDIAL